MAHNLRFNDIKDEDIIEPVYHTVNGLKNKVINNIIKKIAINKYPQRSIATYN